MDKGLSLRRIATLPITVSGQLLDSGDIQIPKDFESIVAFGLHSNDTTKLIQRVTLQLIIDGKVYFYDGTHGKLFYASVNAGVEEVLKDMKQFSPDGTGIKLTNKIMNVKITDNNAAGFAAYEVYVYIQGESNQFNS
jgi:hypothetical protein